MQRRTLVITLGLIVLVALQVVTAFADPLPGETLKFLNSPLMVSPTNPYPGHDEISTVYPTAVAPGYTGQYMADDFADKFNTPVVHVQWWGSYLQGFAGTGVKDFLVAFESDVPAGPNGEPSHPGNILSAQIVTLGQLAPGSGTFTETPLPNPGSPDGGTLYQYNAELQVPFAEKADTVYWLKIVAIVNPATDGQIAWGWHDRDWTVPNVLASTAPAVVPGEHVAGVVPPGLTVNHFQDDAVAGTIGINGLATPPVAGPISPSLIDQAIGTPQNYILPYDGPPGVAGQLPGIDSFSKDLAFALYTRVPEPSSIVLCLLGALGLVALSRPRGK
ncbi:MAG TPA: hypothetical protein VHD36_22070 [Pirellulales bacterium]|nr:hypothetical protein [Pirellulales bacterium]